jgi:hypothetical protein
LPERQIEQPKVDVSGNVSAANANNEQALNPEDSNAQKPEADPNQQPGTENKPEAGTPTAANNQQQNQGQKKGPINGGMLNSKAIYLPVPEVPAGDASGVVIVAIIVDEQGSVVEAKAVSGPAHLHTAAVSAARLARFAPTLLMGEAVRVSGTLSYNFIKSN